MGHDYGSDQLDATDRKAGSRTRLRSFLAIPTVLALTVAAFLSAGVAAALPGSPGVPQAPATLVYHEDFQNQPATNGVRIGQYVGGPAALGETYLTSPNWAPAGDQCNGWVLRSNTPRNTTVTNLDSGCDATAWSFLQGMATAIGLSRGEALATAQQNQILSEYTNGGSAPGPGVEFQTAQPIVTGITPGHFYLISAIYGAANCVSEGPGLNRVDPSLTFNLIQNQTGNGPAPGTGGGTVTTLASGLNPCTASGAQVITTGGHTYHVAKLNSAGFRVPTGVTSLGVQLFNAAGGFRGNDSGFDDPSIVDATPQLDKAFSPTTVNVGQTSTLTFTITNTDDLQAKAGWSFTDNLPAGLVFAGAPVTDCPAGVASLAGTSISGSGNLAAGDVSCTFTVPITSADAGTFTNGPSNVSPINGLLTPGSSTVVFTQPDVPAISLVKSASLTDPSQYVLNAPVTYSFRVSNTGNVPLTGVVVSDTAFSGTGTPPVVTCPQTTLAVNESITCTGPYTITQADIDAGSVTNTAVATGTPPTGANVTDTSNAVISGSAVPALELIKSADASGVQDPAQLNDPIVYTLTATNTGNVTLSGVAITDSLLGAGITYTWPGTAGILLPGQSVTATGSHPVTQAEIDAGVATNTATASGQDPGGNPVPSGPASTTTPLAPGPHLTLDKTASPAFGTPAAVGDLITFGFTITNDGNLTLNTVAITDRLPGLSAIAYTWPGISGVLAPGQSATATATYPITQDDIDAGGVANTAISNGTTPGGADTPSNEDGTNTPIPQAPGIGLTKTADASGVQNPTVVGDPIVYHFTVTNTGNTSLTGVTITDQLAGLSALTYSWPGADGELSPQQSATATATYAVTQADIDNGQVVNSATATGDAPGGGTPQSPPVSTVTPTGAAAALSLVKSASPILASSYTAGQLITYTFVVTNTGNVLVSGIAITETAFSGTGVLGAATCDVTALAPTEQATCTAAYTLTQADVDSGQLSNTATASGTDPNQDPVDSNPSSVVIPSDPSPALTLLKTANLTSVTTAGQVITYTFTVTNTGNVTIAGITISETVFTGAGSAPAPTCPAEAASLAPGQSVDCTATYTDVDADLTGSPILNTATATGVPAGSDPLTTPPSTALVDTVVPEPPTPPEPPAPPVPDVSPLAKTGSTLPVLQFALGAMLILIGTVFTTRNRRRRGTR